MAYITLRGKERLHCARCDTDVGNERMFLAIPDGGHTVYECLCETCDRIEHIPEDQVTFDRMDFGKIIVDLIELGTLYGKEGANGNRTNAKSAGRT